MISELECGFSDFEFRFISYIWEGVEFGFVSSDFRVGISIWELDFEMRWGIWNL